MVQHPQVTIVVVTTRNPGRIETCLKSLEQAAQRTTILVYVVDNAADYDVPGIVGRAYPSARVIRNNTRQGVTYNRNLVLRDCQTRYFMTLDDDVELGENCIDLMYEFMEAHPEGGQVGAALYEKDWSATPVPCGYAISSFPYPMRVSLVDLLNVCGFSRLVSQWARGSAHHKMARAGEAVELSGVVTSCSLIRMEVARQIGLFDEGYRIYLDDLDYSTRIRQAGGKCYQVPGARMIHYVSSSYNPETKRNVAQGCLRYARKFYSYPVFVATFGLASMLYFIKFLARK